MTDSTLTVGMDVHKATISVAVLRGRSQVPEVEQVLPNDPRKVKRFFQRLVKEGPVVTCYEASGCGFVLQRMLAGMGIPCDVVAPSLIPHSPGDRRKTDRGDALNLAKLHRSGLLTPVRVPTVPEEKERGFVRCRQTYSREVHRSRQYVLKHLLARGFVYPGATNWTQEHWRWLRALRLEGADQDVLDTHLSLLDFKLTQHAQMDDQIEVISQSDPYRETVARLRCIKGIDTLTAMTLATEIGDVRRFGDPRQLMDYVGLTPSEHSSGESKKYGGITKAGNGELRRVLVEASWHYAHPAQTSKALKERRHGQPRELIDHCLRAQERLHHRFKALEIRKSKQETVVAVARELVGFVWAVMHNDPLKWRSHRR
jgi:transposase